ncbi:serpin family protein [Halobacteria archaeon AArc-dxtr1]|nr:serpin family protein [Halobacteria archaeon AArc-dxtr1]
MTATKRELLALSGAVLVGLAGCLGDEPDDDRDGNGSGGETTVETTAERIEPEIEPAAVDALVEGNTRFAFDLFEALVDAEPAADHFVSPFSISAALAMTWAGARGETEPEMADTLHFALDQDDLHPAFNALDRELAERSEGGGGSGNEEDDGDPFELNVANALWPAERFDVREPFLETMADHYGARPVSLDFGGDPEGASETINDWVDDQTEGRIDDLVSPGQFDDLTAIVLTNAIYFLAGWAEEFDESGTHDAAFTALDGTTDEVAMMSQTETFPYAEVDGHQLVELPYVGGETSMVVLLPEAGEFEAFEASLDTDRVDDLLAELEEQHGQVELPRFEIESDYELHTVLEALGMERPFDSHESDLTGLIDRDDLHITDVVHEAFVAVDEEGTEAAAATAVIGGADSAPPAVEFELTVDRPFLFLIRDRPTDSVLFLGRVVTVPRDP